MGALILAFAFLPQEPAYAQGGYELLPDGSYRAIPSPSTRVVPLPAGKASQKEIDAALTMRFGYIETGDRALLNLGHTFGHALEAETGFSDRLLHGEAVALGMVLAAKYSARRGEISQADAARAAGAIAAAGLPASLAALGLACDGAALVDHMRHDKKAEGTTLPFLLLRALGEAYVARDVDLADIAAFLDGELAG